MIIIFIHGAYNEETKRRKTD